MNKFSIVLILLVISCGSRNYKEQYLYDKVGFSAGRRPVNVDQNKKIKKTNPIPNYYYKYNSEYSYPGSKYYSNPYNIPPAKLPQQSGYQPRPVYDADQYYVLPNSYKYIERPNVRN